MKILTKKQKLNENIFVKLPYECMAHLVSFIHTKEILKYRLIDKNFDEAICNPFNWTFRTLTILCVPEITSVEKFEETMSNFVKRMKPTRIVKVGKNFQWLSKCTNKLRFLKVHHFKTLRSAKLVLDNEESGIDINQEFFKVLNHLNVLEELEVLFRIKKKTKFQLFNEELVTNIKAKSKSLKKLILGFNLDRQGKFDAIEQIIEWFLRNHQGIEDLSVLAFIQNGDSPPEVNSNCFQIIAKNCSEKFKSLEIDGLHFFEYLEKNKIEKGIRCNSLKTLNFRSSKITDLNLMFIGILFPQLSSLQINKFEKFDRKLSKRRTRRLNKLFDLQGYVEEEKEKRSNGTYFRNLETLDLGETFYHEKIHSVFEFQKIKCLKLRFYALKEFLAKPNIFKNIKRIELQKLPYGRMTETGYKSFFEEKCVGGITGIYEDIDHLEEFMFYGELCFCSLLCICKNFPKLKVLECSNRVQFGLDKHYCNEIDNSFKLIDIDKGDHISNFKEKKKLYLTHGIVNYNLRFLDLSLFCELNPSRFSTRHRPASPVSILEDIRILFPSLTDIKLKLYLHYMHSLPINFKQNKSNLEWGNWMKALFGENNDSLFAVGSKIKKFSLRLESHEHKLKDKIHYKEVFTTLSLEKAKIVQIVVDEFKIHYFRIPLFAFLETYKVLMKMTEMEKCKCPRTSKMIEELSPFAERKGIKFEKIQKMEENEFSRIKKEHESYQNEIKKRCPW